MKTIDAVKNRILQLCAERGITINKLANLSALPPSSLSSPMPLQYPQPMTQIPPL